MSGSFESPRGSMHPRRWAQVTIPSRQYFTEVYKFYFETMQHLIVVAILTVVFAKTGNSTFGALSFLGAALVLCRIVYRLNAFFNAIMPSKTMALVLLLVFAGALGVGLSMVISSIVTELAKVV